MIIVSRFNSSLLEFVFLLKFFRALTQNLFIAFSTNRDDYTIYFDYAYYIGLVLKMNHLIEEGNASIFLEYCFGKREFKYDRVCI